MSNIVATVLLGLAASLCWGSGDFSGGLASRRANASSVVIVAYTVGFVLLVILAFIWKEPFPSMLDSAWGVLAGFAGAIGLIAFYSALSIGRMGIAAPVSAILTAALPVIFNSFIEGLPGWSKLWGFALALLAIGLISRSESDGTGHSTGIGLALLAGFGFGCFFILISRVNHTATFWPLAIARCTSVFFLLIIAWLRRQQVQAKMTVVPLMLIAGVLDAIGNVFFVLAAHTGRLDIAAVLSSLYPAATVLLAALLLRERVTRLQGFGIFLALVAIPLISV